MGIAWGPVGRVLLDGPFFVVARVRFRSLIRGSKLAVLAGDALPFAKQIRCRARAYEDHGQGDTLDTRADATSPREDASVFFRLRTPRG